MKLMYYEEALAAIAVMPGRYHLVEVWGARNDEDDDNEVLFTIVPDRDRHTIKPHFLCETWDDGVQVG